MPPLILKVTADVEKGEQLFISGSCPELGKWQSDAAIVLTNSNNSDKTWQLTMPLKVTDEIRYRYFTGREHSRCEEPHGTSKRIISISNIEGHSRPRTISQESLKNSYVAEDQFGYIGDCFNVQHGWLTEQTELRLRFHGDPLSLFGRDLPAPSFTLKCHPFGFSKGSVLSGQEWPSEFLINNKAMSFTTMPTDGLAYEQGGYLTVGIQSLNLTGMGIALEVTWQDGVDHVTAEAVILPNQMTPLSQGFLSVVLHKKQNRHPVGQLKVDYLIITPLANPCTLENVFARHWNKEKRPLDVGHRGSGRCRDVSVSPFLLENTVKSFNQARSNGADFVEFDVQLTRDKVPVVFHDFVCRLACRGKNGRKAPAVKYDVPVMDLTLNEIRELQVTFAAETGMVEEGDTADHEDDGVTSDPDVALFPLLSDVLLKVNPEVGFNVEIKYCMNLKESGQLEDGLQSYFDRNDVVDVIVSDVLRHAGDRHVVFSCFDPDVCIMLGRKQKKYPVLFLTQGQTERYPHYRDPRTRHVATACRLAGEEGFLGVNPHTEDILKDVTLLDLINKHDLISMCWGNENNDRKVIDLLKDAGTAGVCYDRIHEFKGCDAAVHPSEATKAS